MFTDPLFLVGAGILGLLVLNEVVHRLGAWWDRHLTLSRVAQGAGVGPTNSAPSAKLYGIANEDIGTGELVDILIAPDGSTTVRRHYASTDHSRSSPE